MGQVLRFKTHEHSNMCQYVAVRRAPFNNPRAQSAALHGKTRPDHVQPRAMAEGSVVRESGAEEIVARESFNEEGSVEDIFGNCPPYEPPSAGDAKDEAGEPRISHSDTEPSADKYSMFDREDNKESRMQSLRKSGMRLCGDLCQRTSPKSKARPQHSRIQDRYCPQAIRRMRDQPRDAASVASRHAPSISAVSNNFGPGSPVRIML
jgi:hypothetical protein